MKGIYILNNSMKQMKQWVLATVLVTSGMLMFTACSMEDNPVEESAFRAMLKSLDWGTDTTCMVTKRLTWMLSVRRWATPG